MAKKIKYIFDTQSLLVKEVKTSLRQKFRKGFFYFGICVIIFGVSIFTVYKFFNPAQTSKLYEDLEESRVQYALLEKRFNQLLLVTKDIQQRDDNLYRMIFEAEPPASNHSVYMSTDYQKFSENNLGNIIIQTTQKADELSQQLYFQSKSFDEIYKMALNKKEMILCMPAIMPVNKNKSRLVSGFGMRLHPILRTFRMHTGIDFAAPTGTPVYATGDGVIEASGSLDGYSGYGIVCVVNHGFGFETLYAHLSKVAVSKGQKVKRGDLVGYVGTTGTSTSPHLHYEVIVKGVKTNPIYYFFNDLTPEEYEKAIEKSNEVNQSLS